MLLLESTDSIHVNHSHFFRFLAAIDILIDLRRFLKNESMSLIPTSPHFTLVREEVKARGVFANNVLARDKRTQLIEMFIIKLRGEWCRALSVVFLPGRLGWYNLDNIIF